MRRLAVLLFFAANTAFATPAPTAAGAQPPQPSEPPLSVWRPAADDSWEHLQSGLSCPARFGPYRRTAPETFDNFGLDVGCNYSNLNRTSAFTFYLTRREGTGLEAALDEAKRELLQAGAERHPQLLSDARSTLAGLTWRVALYAEDGGNHSGIRVADLQGWTLEFRATYPAAEDAQASAQVNVMTEAVVASAGAHLRQCAVAPPERAGVRVTDTKQIESAALMSSILGSAGKVAAEDGKSLAKPRPITWCVEKAVREGDIPLLFWRGVHEDGSDAEADQITLVRDKAPVALTVALEPLAALVKAEQGEKGPGFWAATLQQDKRVLIFGYFTGRPPAERLSSFFADVLTGKVKAVGSYSTDGKTITISMPSK